MDKELRDKVVRLLTQIRVSCALQQRQYKAIIEETSKVIEELNNWRDIRYGTERPKVS